MSEHTFFVMVKYKQINKQINLIYMQCDDSLLNQKIYSWHFHLFRFVWGGKGKLNILSLAPLHAEKDEYL